MLIPLKLRAHGACQHLNKEIDFHPGVTIVKGPNGCGKSNLVHVLLYFAITGETVPKGPTKKELLNWSRTAGYVELDFIYNSKEFTLRRNIHNSGIKLTSENEVVFDKEPDKVKELMQEAVGMPYKAFYKTCFAPQRKLTEIVEMTHGDRMAYMQTLFGTEDAEILRGLLKKKADSLPKFPSRTEDIEEKNEEKSRLQASLDGISAQILQWENSKKEYEKSLEQWAAIHRQQPKGTVLPGLNAAKAALQQAEANLQAEENKDPIPVAPEAYAPSMEETENYRKHNQYLEMRGNLEALANDASNAQKSLPAEPVEPSNGEVQSLLNTLNELAPKYTLATNGECPTCGHEKEFPGGEEAKQAVIADYTNTFHAHKAAETAYSQKVSDHAVAKRDYDDKSADFQAKNALWHNTKVKIEEYKQYADFDEEDFKRRTTDAANYAAFLTERKKRDDSLASFRTAVDQAKTSVDHHQELYNNAPDDAVYKQAGDVVDQYDQIKETLGNLRVSENTYKVQIEGIDNQVNTWKDEMKKNAKIAELAEKFEDARQILHKDNLQKLVMSTALNSLNVLLDQYLTYFNKDYTAWIDDNFDFRCAKPDNSDFRAGLLSGGEKVALSMAYMLAVAEVKASRIPIMILDEPTDSLDEEATKGLVEVLKIARGFAEKGLYILIPSHEPLLEAAKSQVVDVSEL